MTLTPLIKNFFYTGNFQLNHFPVELIFHQGEMKVTHKVKQDGEKVFLPQLNFSGQR